MMHAPTPYYGRLLKPGQGRYVTKSWHRPPGLHRNWRGYAVMDGDREVSLHARCSDAYAAMDA